jgi:predicted nucleic acid-binding protein
MIRAIFDTNVFVAAGFNPASASARLLGAARAGRLLAVWHADTRAETRAVLTRIPRLRWADAEAVFVPEGAFAGPLDLAAVAFVTDPQDRKFAALALATGAPLVSADAHLLEHAEALGASPPGRFLDRLEAD